MNFSLANIGNLLTVLRNKFGFLLIFIIFNNSVSFIYQGKLPDCYFSLLLSNNRFYFSAITIRLTSASANSIEYKCSNQDEFNHAVPDSRCTSYYKCSRDKTMVKHDCTPGSTFDFYKQVCSRSAGNFYKKKLMDIVKL